MSKSALDAGIPVLTEVIKVTATNAEQAAKTAPIRAAEPRQHLEVVDVPTIDGWLSEEWNRLERKSADVSCTK